MKSVLKFSIILRSSMSEGTGYLVCMLPCLFACYLYSDLTPLPYLYTDRTSVGSGFDLLAGQIMLLLSKALRIAV